MEYLKEKCIRIFENAKDLFKKGKYKLCAFNVEQAFRLMLKYFLFKKMSDYPFTHSLKILFREASKFCKNLEKFFRENEILIFLKC